MSNFIPMVSESPPPLDEKTFEWGEDEEDFGTFTGANDSASELNVSNNKYDSDYINDNVSKSNGNPVLNHHISSDESDSFADFKSFNESKIHTVSKPQVQKLPLTKDDHINNGNGVENTDSNLDGTVLPGGMKRDSDSGMFSTDISPIPVSEEGTIELNNCDKTVDSMDDDDDDDETDIVPELPTDTDVNGENIVSVQQSPPELNSDVVHTDKSLCSKKENTGSTIPVSSVDVKSKASVDNLVDSDEEFDQYSSQALHSISKEAAQSSILYSHSVNKPENITQNNTLETDDDFGDFADFSDKKIESSNWESSDNKSHSVISNNEVETELPSDSDTNSECITQSKSVEVIDTDKTRDNTADSVPPLNLKTLDISSEDDDTSTTVSNVNINHSEEIDDQNSFFDDNIEKPEESKIVTNENSNDDVDDDEFTDFSKANITESLSVNDSNENDEIKDSENSAQAEFSSVQNDVSDNNSNIQTDDIVTSVVSNDDDDFADFSSVTFPAKSVDNDQSQSNDYEKVIDDNNDDDDDFADFSSAIQPKVENNKTVSNDGDDDDDEFADFSSVTLPNKSQNDDDFAEFSSANINSGSAIKSDSIKHMSDNCEEDDDDDFADFSGANVENQGLTKFEDKKDNFASFDQAKVVDEEDDWGKFDEDDDFDTGVTKQQVYKQQEAVKSQVNVVVQIDKLKTVLHACFNTNDDNIEKNEDISLLESLLVGSIYQQPTHINNGQNSEKKVLKQIFDYDNTNALIYQWKKSHSNDHLFKTLNIDTQNMFFGLKKQSVPLSVTSLTILEPIRGAIDSKKDKNIAALVEPNNTESIPPLQDMPPVEFDWDNSGLTNPLEAKTLDLDFMVLQENENSIKTGDEWDWGKIFML
ncbi:hypothetical protein SNE40_010421 [Patella caerulea]|uniref:Aftiphilin clathrin-binding box domain-containing protein n=1 Tax=Patella caerulea TaxID=87958 RepID=A0AAN8K102_PATCE